MSSDEKGGSVKARVYKVEGMTCQGCVASVTRALVAALPGARLTVELEGGLVRIEGPHDPQAVRRAVEDAGFDFAGEA